MFQIVTNALCRKALISGSAHASALVLTSVVLVACSDTDGGSAPLLSTGEFIDSSAVEGLGYQTLTRSGKTSDTGEFSYDAGESITFSLGGFELPEIQASRKVTPVDIFAATDATDPRVVDLSRLLQSLDVDGDASNGITLPGQVESITSDTVIEFGGDNFETQANFVLEQVLDSSAMLVDSETASSELNEGLVENEVVTGECSSEHPLVGAQAELSTLAHGVSGTITVLNDCVIEVTNFNYDGGGPAVFFYAGVDQNYRTGSFPIGPRLNGRQWVNETLLLTIPDDKSLDDFNSLSVWCFDFNANFGDAVL